MYGSVFGYEHVLDPMYSALFGLSEKPIEVMEANTTIEIILAAVCIGIFLVLCAILINIFCSLSAENGKARCLGRTVSLVSFSMEAIVVGFGGQLAFGWQIVTPVYIVLFIVLPLLGDDVLPAFSAPWWSASPTGSGELGRLHCGKFL